MQSVLLVWLSTLVFAIIHSLLAGRRCKRWMARLGLHEPGYRLVYTMISIFMAMAWVGFIHALPDSPLYSISGVMMILFIAVQITGACLVIAAFRPIDTMAFLGFRSAGHDVDPFIISGIYRYLRHPMYSGVMLILLGSPWQSVNSLHMTLAVTLYFFIGARFEECRMMAQHPEYAAYRQRVPAFLPLLRPSMNQSE